MRGVDIALILSGPARRLNVSYRSDPPLSFSDLVNLVAVGRDPTTDPLSVSRQRIEQQSLFQIGANNVLAQAVQSPVSPGLQRFFGVSRLKVDPAVGGAEANPAARISTEQQLTDDITLIYTYDLSSSQQQTARLEWTPSRRWTLVVTRDENGLLGSDAIYKTRRP
jgi:translocation and assembly module TamB